MQSILQNSNKCLLCGTTLGLEVHHVFYGPFRKASDRHGLTVKLCHLCHRGKGGVHFNTALDLRLKKAAQKRFESIHGHEEFIEIFRKDYI